ncbi:MAG: GTP pyrophosphokinase [bacterium ADurb.Bin270]|nr:MAG: GTP pyrophosphokinase [bacterium ADurb.Bin270]
MTTFPSLGDDKRMVFRGALNLLIFRRLLKYFRLHGLAEPVKSLICIFFIVARIVCLPERSTQLFLQEAEKQGTMRFPVLKPFNFPFAATPAPFAPVAFAGQAGSSSAPVFTICQVKNFCKRFAPGAPHGISAGSIFAPSHAMAFAGDAGSGAAIFSSGDAAASAALKSSEIFAGLYGFPDHDPDDTSEPKKKLFERLEKLGHKDLKLVRSALDNLSTLSTDSQIRNLRCAFLLASWDSSTPAIAAALISGKKDYSISGNGKSEVKKLLSQLERTKSFTCDWSDKNQYGRLMSLLFAISNSHEELMLLAAQDTVDAGLLSQRPSSGLDRESEEKMQRSRFVTSQILKYFGFSQDGGTLEDVAFRHLEPFSYEEMEEHLRKQVGMDRRSSNARLEEISRELRDALDAKGIGHYIEHRMKTTVSARVRRDKKGNNRDTNGIRIIINDDRDEMCYEAMEEVKAYFTARGWEYLPEHYDDYIYVKQKANGYKSLHAYYKDSSGYLLEVQVRTSAMHMNAEFGSAAHGAYKTGETVQLTTSSDIDPPRTLFKAKKDGIHSSGTFFVIDDSNGKILKIVTGSQDRKPSLLDAAFARDAFSALYADVGFLEGSSKKLESRIESGQRFDFQTRGHSIFPTRIHIVKTPYARAMMLYAATVAEKNFSLDPRKINKEYLSGHGKAELARISSEVKEELINSQGGRKFGTASPTFLFSFERLYRRLGFKTEEEFFITLGAFRKASEISKTSGAWRQDFVNEVKSRIMANSILFTRYDRNEKVSARLLLRHDSSLLKNILLSAFDYGLSFSSVKFERVGESQQALLEFEMPIDEPSKLEAVDEFFSTLEDSYRGTPPPYVGKVTFMDVVVERTEFADKGVMQSVLEALLNDRVKIDWCDLEDTPTGKFKVRIPLTGGMSRDNVEKIIRSKMKIKGVGSLQIVSADGVERRFIERTQSWANRIMGANPKKPR